MSETPTTAAGASYPGVAVVPTGGAAAMPREVAYPALEPTTTRLRDAVGMLSAELDALSVRLGPVLGSGTPHPASAVDPTPPAGDSELVKAITAEAARIEGLRQHVASLINRLEV